MFSDINELLHHERGENIKALPDGAKVFLSAGCSGTWYFNWVKEKYGLVDRHIGVEFYSPKPSDLPSEVEWICNTVGDMRDVGDESVDILFSGENLEHLWPDEVVKFYLESARVLKPGGHLVVDSPNRLVTDPMKWSHPEHTVELTPAEACMMANLAGFDVTKIRGIWLCRDPYTGDILPNSVTENGNLDQSTRISGAHMDPENSILWWVEAVRSRRSPRLDELQAVMRSIFERAWPQRCLRFFNLIGVLGDQGVHVPKGVKGVALYGPYMPLPAGDYVAEFEFKFKWNKRAAVWCDVMAGEVQIAKVDVDFDRGFSSGVAKIPFTIDRMTFGFQFRVISNGLVGFFAAFPKIRNADASAVYSATLLE